MLAYELFLTRNEMTKLQLFQEYVDLPPKYQEISRFAEHVRLSTTSVYRSMHLIEEDERVIRKLRGEDVITKNTTYASRVNLSASEYAVFLMRRSIPAQFLLYTLSQAHPDFKSFVDSTGRSRQTVTRQLRPLRDFLAQYGIHFVARGFNISGDERVIRFILADLIWQLTQDGFELWPEKYAAATGLAKELVRTGIVGANFAHLRLRAICLVHLLREEGHFLGTPNESLDLLIQETGHQPTKMPQWVSQHLGATNLIVNQTLIGTCFNDAGEPQLARFIGYHVRMNTHGWQLTTIILRKMRLIAGVNTAALDDQLFIANLLAVIVSVEHIGAELPAFDPVITATGLAIPEQLRKVLVATFTNLPSTLAYLGPLAATMQKRLLPILATAIQDARRRLRVAIDLSMEHQLFDAVEKALEHMPAVEFVKMTEHPRLVITTNLLPAQAHRTDATEWYYFELNSFAAWLALEHYIYYLSHVKMGDDGDASIHFNRLRMGVSAVNFDQYEENE